ncbi:MAG: PAC2 family protein [Halanaerobiaceae bacterium]
MLKNNLEFSQPLPELQNPHAIAILRPYLNAKDVGTLILDRLKNNFNSKKLGELKNPGNFYDFTRYRPQTYFGNNGNKKIEIPNTKIFYASQKKGQDFIFLNLLEPHYQGEKYVNIIYEILNKLEIQRYCLLGSMNNTVPHTKPLLVSGEVPDYILKKEELNIQSSNYEGPTSIVFNLNHKLKKIEKEVIYLLVSVPQYLQYFKLENGFIPGKIRLIKILNNLYDIPVLNLEKKRAENQIKKIDEKIDESPRLKPLVNYFEELYQKKKNKVPLSPEIEKTIKNMEEKWQDKGTHND